MEYIKPSLTEFKTKYYLRNSLIETRKFKDKYITIIVNIILFISFIGIIGGLLYYKYKGKTSYEEINKRQQQKKMYIFQKLQKYAHDKEKASQRLITNLPLV
jgi:hypothetical protein